MKKLRIAKNIVLAAAVSGFALQAFAQSAPAAMPEHPGAPSEIPGSPAPTPSPDGMPNMGAPKADPMAPTPDAGSMQQMMPGTSTPPEVMASVPTPPVAEMPKADPEMMHKMSVMFNNKDIDGLMTMFPQSDFEYITSMGSNFTNADNLKKHFVDMFAGQKFTITMNKSEVKELAPGVAYYTGSYSEVMEHGKTSEFMATIVAKYEDGAWKIMSMHMSPVIDTHQAAMHESKPSSSMAIIAGLLGILVGYFGNRFMTKKTEETA